MPNFAKLEALLAEMEKPELPKGFTWNMDQVLVHQVELSNGRVCLEGPVITMKKRTEGHVCGTAGCAIGVAMIAGLISPEAMWRYEVSQEFGITGFQADDLFYPDPLVLQEEGIKSGDMKDVTREMQTERIRKFIAKLKATS